MVSTFCLFLFMVLTQVAYVEVKLPSSISQHQYCMGCIATVTELGKKLSKRHLTGANREAKVMELIEDICKAPNFVNYDYSPPKSVAACQALLEDHDVDLENALVKNIEDVEKHICHDVSKACEGIDLSDKKKPKDLADIDLTSEEGKPGSKTVKIDPQTNRVKNEEKSNEGKTLSKKDKKKAKKSSSKKTTTKTKTKSAKKSNDGKGSINHLNIDINDPSSMDKVMEQIRAIQEQETQKMNKKKKEEL